jgi:molecular chaperone GrpE (heat shock protein)
VILTEYMRQFLAHLTPDLKENDLIKWLQLSYDKFIGTELAGYGIKQIDSLGLTPDSELHEVVMMDTVTESDIILLNSLGHEWSDFAGRIIREFEVGYYYMDSETRHIIKAAKVVVGQ